METRIIVIAAEKGGVGKTAITANLAELFAGSGSKVLCVDTDPQGNLSKQLTWEEKNNWVDYCVANFVSASFLPGADPSVYVQKTTNENIDLIPGHSSTNHLDKVYESRAEAVGKSQTPYVFLREALERFMGDYDIILIDTPPSTGLNTLSAIYSATDLLFVVECDEFAFDGFYSSFQLEIDLRALEKNQGRERNTNILGIIFNKVDLRLSHSKECIEVFQNSDFKNLLFDTVVRQTKDFKEATSEQKTLMQYRPYCNPAMDLKKLHLQIKRRMNRR